MTPPNRHDDVDDEGLFVPCENLQPETLRAVVENFVTREGTDYGTTEHSLTDKVDDVLRQLRDGRARLSFDPASGSIDVVAANPRDRRRRN